MTPRGSADVRLFGWPGPPLRGGSLRARSDHDWAVNIGRLILVALVALILSAPATASVSPDVRYGSGDVLALAKAQLTSVVAELR
jgi:hypothetical protein